MMKKIAIVIAAIAVIGFGYMMIHGKVTPTENNAPAAVYKGQ